MVKVVSGNKILLIVLMFFSGCDYLLSQEVNSKSHEFAYALIEASRMKMSGNLDEAVKLYKFCTEADEKCAAAWYELASIYSATGKNKEAEEFIRKAYSIDNTNYWYVVAFTDILGMNGKHKENIKILKKASKTFKSKNDLLFEFSLAESYFLMGKINKAITILDKMEKKYGKSEYITLQKIDFYSSINKHELIVKTYYDFVTADPGNLIVYLRYGDYLVENEFYQDAVNVYESVLKIDESNIYAVSNLADLYGKLGNESMSLNFLADAFRSDKLSFQKKIQSLSFLMNDEERMKNNYNKLLDLLEILMNVENDNYELLIVAYDFYYKNEMYEKSLEIIEKLVELKDDNYIIWIQAVYNANMLEKHEKVIELGNKALKIFPNKDDLRVFISLAWYNMENYEEAYKILIECGTRFSEPEIARQKQLLIAEAAYKSGNIKEAFDYFEELIVKEPENLYAKNNYAFYMALEGLNLQRAKELSFETIKREPENSSFLDTYAWILFKLMETEKAEKYIRKAMEVGGEKSREIIDHFIEILTYNGKVGEADEVKKKFENE